VQPIRQIILKSKDKRSFSGRHPWILANSIVEPASTVELGEQVDLINGEGKWIGRGFYNPDSRIRVRLYTWDEKESLDSELVRHRIDRAIELRSRFSTGAHDEAFRVIFSEADQLSGLVVDKYGDHLVLQITSACLLQFQDAIVDRLVHHYRPMSVSIQVDDRTAASEGMEAKHEFVVGHAPEEPITIVENGLKWTEDGLLLGSTRQSIRSSALDQREREGSRCLLLCRGFFADDRTTSTSRDHHGDR
jgi:23S rRNA (cytosine1962-C5)-methyltransferase